jgi:hypothetical protein
MPFERKVLEGFIWVLISASLIEGFPWIFPQRGQRFLNQMSIKVDSEYKDSFVSKKSEKP